MSTVDTSYEFDIYGKFITIILSSSEKRITWRTDLIHIKKVSDTRFLIGEVDNLLLLTYTNDINNGFGNIDDYLEDLVEQLTIEETNISTGTSSAITIQNLDFKTVNGETLAAGEGIITDGTLRMSLATNDNIVVETINQGVTLLELDSDLNTVNTNLTSIITELTNQGTTMVETEMDFDSIISNLNTLITEINNIGTTTVSDYTENINQGITLSSNYTELMNQGITMINNYNENINQGTTLSSTNTNIINQGTTLSSTYTTLVNTGTTDTSNYTELVNQGITLNNINVGTTQLYSDALDYAVQLRTRITYNPVYGDNDYSGSFNSLFMDGQCDTTLRSTGMPIDSNNPIITFPDCTLGTTQMRIASTSTLDVGFSIYIKGLDENWEAISTSVTMAGQTPVLVDTQFMRITHKMFVYNLDGTGLKYNQGDIYLGDANASNWTDGQPDAGSPVYYCIQKLYNWSSMGITTVPAKTYSNFSKGNDYSSSIASKPIRFYEEHTYPWDLSTPNVNRIPITVGNLISTTNTSFDADAGGADTPYTDIHFQVRADSGSSTYSVYWELFYLKRPEFP